MLFSYIKSGAITSVCCNGLEKIDESIEEILIAGMGGEELVSILKAAYIPRAFVLQPMRNVRSVREFLLSRGALLTVEIGRASCRERV